MLSEGWGFISLSSGGSGVGGKKEVYSGTLDRGIDVRDHEEEEEDNEKVELVIELCGRLRGGAVDVGCWFL